MIILVIPKIMELVRSSWKSAMIEQTRTNHDVLGRCSWRVWMDDWEEREDEEIRWRDDFDDDDDDDDHDHDHDDDDDGVGCDDDDDDGVGCDDDDDDGVGCDDDDDDDDDDDFR